VKPLTSAVRSELNHLHLKVDDPERSTLFYIGSLGFELNQRFESEFILTSKSGRSMLVISPADAGRQSLDDTTMDHFGFSVPSEAEMTKVVETMVELGAKVIDAGARDGVPYTFVESPDGHQVEIVAVATSSDQ
jgi:catechol 2,3-dioxygenase-like lactoylglutathione lyase family enzyme